FDDDAYSDRTNPYIRVVAHLAPGVDIAAARSELGVIAAQLERAYPKENAHIGATVNGLHEEVGRRSRTLVLALLGAAACVLLIACLNLANLLLARALLRRKELALRTALGAGRDRLVRQLVTASLVLALCCGAAAGCSACCSRWGSCRCWPGWCRRGCPSPPRRRWTCASSASPPARRSSPRSSSASCPRCARAAASIRRACATARAPAPGR